MHSHKYAPQASSPCLHGTTVQPGGLAEGVHKQGGLLRIFGEAELLVHKGMEVFAPNTVCDKRYTKKTVENEENILKVFTDCVQDNS